MLCTKRVIFLAVLLISSVRLAAQETKADSVELAKTYVDVAKEVLAATKAEDQALENFELAANLDPDNLYANYEAGDLRLRTVGRSLAAKYFLRVLQRDPEYNFAILYWIGRAYQYGEDFDKAIDFYNQYLAKVKAKPNYKGKDKISTAEVDRKIYECNNGKEFKSNPGNFSIVNIGREINSEFEDYAPVLNEAEDEIVFTTRRRDDNLNPDVFEDNKPYEDIFIANKSNGKWSAAKNIGAQVNTPYHDSNLALSPDGNLLFIYNDDNGGDIFYCQYKNDKWSEPLPLPGIINSSYEENSVSISKDGKILYFSSNRPGGFGGLDIYRATQDSKGEWSAVKNLGPKINTEYNDTSPFIDYDQKTLHFSTQGRKGMGGYDIFKSVFTEGAGGGEWSEPENMGYPINTPDDDVFYVRSEDGKRAYYASVREDGLGFTDIYIITEPVPVASKDPEPKPPVTEPKKEEPKKDSVVVADVPKEPVKKPVEEPVKKPVEEPAKEPEPEVKPEPIVKEPEPEVKKPEPVKQKLPSVYTVKVVDAGSQAALDARVSLKGLKDNVVVAQKSLGTGEYEFTLNAAQAKDYRLSVEVEGYSFQNINVKLDGLLENPKNTSRTVTMRKLKVGSVSILRNIYFDFDKATFTTDAYPELNKLLSMMQQNTSLSVEIGGHTDSFGSKEVNLRLSKRRAEAVKDYLVKKGIDARRITAKGYGKSKPLASNDDEDEGRELNRRVEFKVLKN